MEQAFGGPRTASERTARLFTDWRQLEFPLNDN
jgi:hypothetical protein